MNSKPVIKQTAETDRGVHSIGNGKVCAYIRGADIFDIMGPYYSTPPLIKLLCGSEGKLKTRRVPGSAVWDYSLEGYGFWRDFTVPSLPVFIRKVEADKPVNWHIVRLNVNSISRAPVSLLEGTRFKKAWYGPVAAGTFFYANQRDKSGNALQGYPIADRLFVIVGISGNAEELFSGEDEAAFAIDKGDICIICAGDEDEGWNIFEKIGAVESGTLCERALDEWRRFTCARTVHFEKTHPRLNGEYSRAADEIAVLLKTQQDDSGGILAGCNYHLSYVRDNYGCFRGLLALGCLEEAKKLLRYYADVYNRYGKIATAQGMGTYAFHKHEHDFAENTGYLVLMGMEYYNLTNDTALLKELHPMLKWALSVQRKHLTNNMLPFSGDETYIAGGILPRANIQDASMEATLLYHRSLELYLSAAKKTGLADEAFLKDQEAALTGIANTFTENFIEDGILYCNKPGLYDEESAPGRRWGVMECGHGFGLSYRNKNGRYVCIKCLGQQNLDPVPPKRYKLLSTVFMPLWIHSSLVPFPILKAMVNEIIRAWKETGRLPSRPDGGLTVGYDYGLTLYALSRCFPEDTETLNEFCTAMLNIRDSTGAWVEYYRSGIPTGTPCRPWESAVNIAALLEPADV
jgi:hypothetical protein